MRETSGSPGRTVSTRRGDESLGRRRVLAASAGFAVVGLAGCSFDVADDDPTDRETGDEGDGGTGSEPDEAETGPVGSDQDGDGTEAPNGDDGSDGDGDDESDDGEVGDIHAHGRLYVAVDGERVDFSQPKYVEESDHPDGRAPHRFHFHAGDGEQYTWHMHDERPTLAEAMDALPDIAYENDGGHVVEVDGESYVDGEGGTTITYSQLDTEIDPQEHELQDQDVIYVTIESGGA